MEQITLDRNKARFQADALNILHVYSFDQRINGNVGKTLCGVNMLHMKMLMAHVSSVEWVCAECGELAEKNNVAHRSDKQ